MCESVPSLSQRIGSGLFSSLCSISLHNCNSHLLSLAASKHAICSASSVDMATMSCFIFVVEWSCSIISLPHMEAFKHRTDEPSLAKTDCAILVSVDLDSEEFVERCRDW